MQPQLSPMTQPPPPTGCTGNAPPAGRGGVDTTGDDGLAAPASDSTDPPAPRPTAKTKAAPPNIAALRCVTALNCSLSSEAAQFDQMHEAATHENPTDFRTLAGTAQWRCRRGRGHHRAGRDHLPRHRGAGP